MKNTFKILKYILLTGMLLFSFTLLKAQNETYVTRSGNLTIQGIFDNKPLSFTTNQLAIRLDYETAEMQLSFYINSLKTDNDSINKLLQKNDTYVSFKGKLGMDYIKTDDHPPMKFSVFGMLEVNNQESEIRGEGELLHIGNEGTYSCVMGMSMLLNFDDLGLNPPLEDLNNEFEVRVVQALLELNKN